MSTVKLIKHALKVANLMSRITLASRCLQTRNHSSEASQRQFNVGVLGAGRIGRMHMANVLQNRDLKVAWVVEDVDSASDALRVDFRLDDIPFHKSEKFSSLLAEHSLDGVLIFTSTPSHTKLTCQALQNGKAVFVEKPVGESTEDVRKCYDAAEASGRPLLTGYNRRFDPTISEAIDQFKKGAVGTLQYISFTMRDSPKPSYDFLKGADTSGCNILADLCVHDIDQLVWMTNGERPEHIYVTTHAHDSVMADFGEADAIGILIKYSSGAMASLNAFRESCYGYDVRMEIFGSDGCIIANNPRETSVTLDVQDGGRQNRLYNSFPQRFERSFQAEIEHFVDCMKGTAQPLVTKKESLMVSEIVEKGLESFNTKQPVFF